MDGVIFTQQGVAVPGSSDYQKVIDSRWVFMEVEAENPINVTLPATGGVAVANRFYEKTIILRHNLNFLPAFEASISFTGTAGIDDVTIHADENTIFLRRLITTSAHPSQTVTGSYRLYNLPILQEYEAPKEIVSGASAPKTTFGMKFVDGSVPNVGPADVSTEGFSVDTTKKILSVHKHGLKYFNKSVLAYFAKVTAIDTSTDIWTVAPLARTSSSNYDLTWVQSVNAPVVYFPGDFTTYPAPLNSNSGTIYTIPVDATHIKIAGGLAAAIDRIGFDFTTAGSLPGTLQGAGVAGEDTITHNIGYPPTYLLARVNDDEPAFGLGTKTYMDPISYRPDALVKADNTKLTFRGVQALFAGQYGYIILKDPAEIAQ